MTSARVRGVIACSSRSKSRCQPFASIDHRHADGPGAGNGDRAGEIRPGRGRDQHLVAVAGEHAEGDLHRRHAAGGDEEALGVERLAVDPLVVAGDGLAQFGDAALIGVEGLALRQRLRRRLADEGRRRQVALADPERDDAGLEPTVAEHVDDAARRRLLRLGAQVENGRNRDGRVHREISSETGEQGWPVRTPQGKPRIASHDKRRRVRSKPVMDSGRPARLQEVADFRQQLHVGWNFRRLVGRAGLGILRAAQAVHALDQEEQDPGDDDEVDGDREEVAPGRARRPGSWLPRETAAVTLPDRGVK